MAWLGLVELVAVLVLLDDTAGEDAAAEVFVTAEVAGAVGLWLAAPLEAVLWPFEGCPDSAKARAAPPAPPPRAPTPSTRP